MPTIKDVIVWKPSGEETRVCQTWPIWTHDAGEFEWEYTQTEKCLIVEGRVTVSDLSGSQSVSFGTGDFVQFPNGLKCIWKITQAVRKHYDFE